MRKNARQIVKGTWDRRRTCSARALDWLFFFVYPLVSKRLFVTVILIQSFSVYVD